MSFTDKTKGKKINNAYQDCCLSHFETEPNKMPFTRVVHTKCLSLHWLMNPRCYKRAIQIIRDILWECCVTFFSF